MLYSKTLLQRYLSVNEDIETIANQLTLKSSEVEQTIKREIPSGVVIGKVLTVKEHNNADKLVVCTVDCGSHGEFQICTGATNVEQDSYVPVAIPGTYLPSINITIQTRKMRGEESKGMICSKEELSIQDDVGMHGIWVLQSAKKRTSRNHVDDNFAGDFSDITDKDLGIPLIDKLPWLEGWIIDVENKTITHRPDMFGHIGLVFELQAIFPKSLGFNKIKDLKEKSSLSHILQLIEHAKKSNFPVSIQSPNTHAYITLELNNITVNPSDFFTKLTLIDSGLESKSNRVDFSNIFMHSTGHPIHIFDKDKITGGILVRQAYKDEKFTDLFDKEHILNENDIVIADEKKILALAGIIGAKGGGVSHDTNNVLIEIANFDPVSVRKTAMRLGIRTEASVRYEKSINPLFTLACLELLFDHLKYYKSSLGAWDMQGATNRINEASNVHITESIDINWQYVYKTIYGNLEADEATISLFKKDASDILSNLGYHVGGHFVQPPSRRAPEDITCDEDIIEDIVRIIGYNSLTSKNLEFQGKYKNFEGFTKHRRKIEEYFSTVIKANQVETYPWIDQSRINKGFVGSDNLLSCKNPLNPEKTYLRGTIIWNLLESIIKNNAFYDDLTIFDIGKIWNNKWEKKEHISIGFAVCRKKSEPLKHPLRYAKSYIQGILNTCGIHEEVEFQKTTNHNFHPKQQAIIYMNSVAIGSLQTMHPLLLEELKIDPELVVTIGEIDYTVLQEFINNNTGVEYSYETLSQQIVWRDLSFIIDTNKTFDIVTDALLSCQEITDVEIFDLYQGPTIPQGTKSCAVRIKIPAYAIDNNKEKNITTETINIVLNKAIQAAEKVGAKLRSE